MKMHTMPIEAAKNRRRANEYERTRRRNELLPYVAAVLEHPHEAVVFEDYGESGRKFVMRLRLALRYAGVKATVRKVKNVEEIRCWLNDEAEDAAETEQRVYG